MSSTDKSDKRQRGVAEETSRRVAILTDRLIDKGFEVRDMGDVLAVSKGSLRETLRKDIMSPPSWWRPKHETGSVRLSRMQQEAAQAGYGNYDPELCAHCGDPVGTKRRAARPDTPWCVYCAASLEKRGFVVLGKINEWHLTIENLLAPMVSLQKVTLADLFARDDSGEFSVSDSYQLPEVLRTPKEVRFVIVNYAADLGLFVGRVGDRMEFDVDGLTRKFEDRSRLNPATLSTNGRILREACTHESGLQCLAILALSCAKKDLDTDMQRVRDVVFRAFRTQE